MKKLMNICRTATIVIGIIMALIVIVWIIMGIWWNPLVTHPFIVLFAKITGTTFLALVICLFSWLIVEANL